MRNLRIQLLRFFEFFKTFGRFPGMQQGQTVVDPLANRPRRQIERLLKLLERFGLSRRILVEGLAQVSRLSQPILFGLIRLKAEQQQCRQTLLSILSEVSTSSSSGLQAFPFGDF